MPRIPTYDGPQTTSQALPQVRQQGVGSFQGMGQSTNAVAQGLNRLSNQVNLEAERIQRERNQAEGTKLSASFVDAVTQYKVQSKQRLGEQAFNLPQESDKFYDDLTAETIKQTPNDKVKRYLEAFTAQQRAGFRGYVAAHSADQIKKSKDAGFATYIISQIEANAIDPTLAENASTEVKTATTAYLKEQGITDPLQVKDAVQANLTKLHAGAINTLMIHDPKRASAYYGAHKDDIDGLARAKIEKSLELSTRSIRAQGLADELMEGVRTGKMSYTEAEAAARKQSSGDERNEVIRELRSQRSEYENAQAEAQAEMFDPINKALAEYTVNGRSIPTKVQRDLLNGLKADPETYNKAAQLFDQHNDEIRREHRATSDRARALASDKKQTALNGLQLKYDMLNNPNNWKNVDLSQTLLLLVKDKAISASDANRLIDLQTKMRTSKSSEMASLTTASQHLETMLNSAVIDGKEYASMKTNQRREVKARALRVLDPLLEEYQSATGEKASKDEMKAIVESIFVDKEKKAFWFWQDDSVETQVDLENAAPRVSELATMRAIPPATRQRIEAALIKHGYKPTPENILQAYKAR